jgi:RHS repeat-associated protein
VYSSSQKIYRFGRVFDAKYVRFLFKTSTSAATFWISRLDVLTVPDDGAAALGTTSGMGFDANLNGVIDADPANGAWTSDGNARTVEQLFTVGLPAAKPWSIDHVAIQQYTTCCFDLAPRDFEIQVTTGDTSDASFVTVHRGTLRPDFSVEHAFFPAVSARAVRLIVHNNWGGATISIQNFWIFSPQIGPRIARFLDTSVPGARTIVSWSWTFGDGGTSTDRDPVHVYAGAGTYEVALTVTDADGLTTRRTMQYTVYGDAMADFTVSPNPPLEQTNALLVDTSTSLSGPIASSDWLFGDNSAPQLNLKAVNHVFMDSGTYNVTHTVHDIRGVVAKVTKPVVVANVPPTVSAGPDLTAAWNEPWPVAPVVSDVLADASSISCHWAFGDGTTADVTDCAKNAAVVHRYATMGTFTATLTATDKDGGSASDTVVTTTTRRPTLVSYAGTRGVAIDGSIALAAVLRDGLSHDLLGGTITFDVSGQTVTAIADATGRATASILYTGTTQPPVVTVRYDGDANYVGSTATATLTCPPNQQSLAVAQVIDLSGSMETTLKDAKAAFVQMIDSLVPGRDQASTIVFADWSEVRQPLTTDLELARKAVDTFAIFGGTNIASGIYAAINELTGPRRNPAAQPVLILFSDGGDSPGSVIAAANAAKAAGIRIISVGWKAADYHPEVMGPIASSPSDYYVVTNAAQLEPLFMALPGTLCVAANAAPVANAGGGELTVALPQTTVTLKGTAADDGKPAGATLTYLWTKASGPGDVVFGSPTALQTTVSMTVAGTYLMRLAVSDGELTGESFVTCVLKPENQAPHADAGPDLTTTISLELVKNRDAEEALVNGKVPSWTATAGTWTATTAGPAALRGTHTFTSSGPTATEIFQDIDVTAYGALIDAGLQKFDWSVYVRVADETPSDAAKVVIEYNGNNNSSTIKTVATDDITTSHLWARIGIVEVAPPGTRFIRIRLIAARHSGATNDVWFDAVSLRAVDTGVAASLGTASDDREPANILRTTWTQISGPAPSSIFNGLRPDAFFAVNTAGVYTYRMTVDDSAKTASDELTVTAIAGNAAPVVNAGADATVALPANGTLSATAIDESTSIAWTWFFLSGPTGVVIADPHAATTEVTFPVAGAYVFRVVGDDGDRISSDDVTITVTPPAGNQAPVVNAGPDAIVTDPPRTGTLHGSATDDGLPEGATLTYAWSLVSGPGQPQFETPSQPITNVSFPAIGTYVLRLSSSDTNKIGTDDVIVTVVTNRAPTVNAGEDVIFTDSQPIPRLGGGASDNDIPPGGALTVLWTRVSGPGNATIAAPTQLSSAITLTAHGRHVFRLTATDGQVSASDDVIITWDGANTAPTVNAGADQTVTLPAKATLDASVIDDGLPITGALSIGWSRVSGPGNVTFDNAGAASTAATFPVAGDYVLRITVTDGEVTASDDIAITVKDAVPPPTAEITSPESGTAISDRVTIRGTVSNATGWRLEYRLSSGDPAGAPWTPIASGNGSMTDAILGTFDPTNLLNGTYKVRLVGLAADGSGITDTITVSVEGSLKVGVFTLAFTDFDFAVAGVPIQVSRNYDSRDKTSGDFGVGWKLGVASMRIEKSGVIGTGWRQNVSGVPPLLQYCIAPTLPHFVTITFADGRVYRFAAAVTPQCQAFAPIETPSIVFVPAGTSKGSLVAAGDNTVLTHGSVPGPIELLDFDAQPYDPTQFTLTIEDGTKYVIDSAFGVRSIADRDGNTISISPTGITHSRGASVTFARDSAGRVTTVTEPSGKALHYAYDGRGDLVGVTDEENQTTAFGYDTKHNLVSITDARGVQPLRNEYDDDGRLVRQLDAEGKETLYTHDVVGHREIITDRLGRQTTIVHDSYGSVLSQTDALGRVTAFTYDANHRKTSQTDPAGNTTSYTYDAAGNINTLTDPLGHVTRYTQDENHQPLTITDVAGHVTRYVYDAAGRLVETHDANGKIARNTYSAAGLLLSMTDPTGKAMSFLYDSLGRVVQSLDGNGKVTDYGYDDAGNRTSISETVASPPSSSSTSKSRFATTSAGAVTSTSMTYNGVKQPTVTTFADGTTRRTEYDSVGNVKAEVDPLGQRTTYEYDASKRRTKQTNPDGTTEQWTYDAEGHLLTRIDRGGRTVSFTYDAAGRLTKATLPSGASASVGYDVLDRVISRTDARGKTTHYEYDPDCGCRERLTKITDARGNATKFAYDAIGNRISRTDSNGHTTQYEYDDLRRATKIVRPDGSTESVKYDDAGRVTEKKDPAGNVMQYVYDENGLFTDVVDALGRVTSYVRDAQGNVIEQVDRDGRSTTYEFDVMGRRTRRTLPSGASETYGYDLAGRLIARTDFSGRTTSYAYDAMGRMTSKRPDSRTGEHAVTFTYTPMGLRQSMSDGNGTSSYTYDADYNLVKVASPFGDLLYSYDQAGNLLTTRSSHQDGVTVDYAYDDLGRLDTVTDARAGTTRYTFDDDGNVDGFTYGNGVQTSYTYDSLEQMTGVSTSAGGATISSYDYELGPAGHRLAVTELGGRRVAYDYDALFQLLGENVTGDAHGVNGGVAYTYDPSGNRKTRTSTLAGIADVAYESDVDDRTVGGVYDLNGNSLANASHTFQYDSDDRIISADGGAIRLVYDGDGNRVAETVNGVTVQYLVDTNNPTGFPQVVEELRNGLVTRAYTWGNHLIAQRQLIGNAWTTSHYGYDGHGNVRFLTDDDGAVTDTFDYDAFGALLHRSGTTPNVFLFNAEQYDANLGLYYLRARHYDPSTGRFTSMDAFEGDDFDPMSLHKYLYGGGDPVNTIDPSGQWTLAEIGETIKVATILNGIDTAGLSGYVTFFRAAAWGAVGGGAFGGVDGFMQGLYEGAIFDHVIKGAGQGAVIGAIAGPLAMFKYIRPVLNAMGIVMSGVSVYEAAQKGQTWVAVFRAVTSVVGIPYVYQKIRGLVGKVTISAGGAGDVTGIAEFPTASSGEHLHLTYKPGWSAEQIAAADLKVQALNEAALRGELHVTPSDRKGTIASKIWARAGNSKPPNTDIDHIVDLQLGGSRELHNMRPLDSSVNRSLGPQIHARTKGIPIGTPIGGVTIGPR